jgi:competence ComEA-like helix-hairpin-helix protein
MIPYILDSFTEPDRIIVYRNLPDEKAETGEEKEIAIADSVSVEINSASREEIESLGISSETARKWVNYRKALGSFSSIEQIKKVYGISDSLFQEIEPHLTVKSDVNEKSSKKKEFASFSNNFAASAPEKQSKIIEREFSPFDPNSTSVDSLQLLGLSEKVARTLINYRKSGAVIKDVDDLSSVYGVEEEWVDQIAEYARFPEPESPQKTTERINSFQREIEVDINLADASEFMELYGIGEVLSERILKYRQSLGGFHSIDQLSDVYGIADSTFQEFRENLSMSEIPLNRIRINTTNLSLLKLHPYVSYKQAKVILAYRQHHGYFQEPDDLKRVIILSDEWIEKMEPYIDFSIPADGVAGNE